MVIASTYHLSRNIEFSTEENIPEKFDIIGDYIIHAPEKAAELDVKVDQIIKEAKLTSPPHRYRFHVVFYSAFFAVVVEMYSFKQWRIVLIATELLVVFPNKMMSPN